MILIYKYKVEGDDLPNPFTFHFTDQFGNFTEYPALNIIPRRMVDRVRIAVRDPLKNTVEQVEINTEVMDNLLHLNLSLLTFESEKRYTITLFDEIEVIYTDQIMITEQEPRDYNILWFNKTKI